jgi:hypothetical protein
LQGFTELSYGLSSLQLTLIIAKCYKADIIGRDGYCTILITDNNLDGFTSKFILLSHFLVHYDIDQVNSSPKSLVVEIQRNRKSHIASNMYYFYIICNLSL